MQVEFIRQKKNNMSKNSLVLSLWGNIKPQAMHTSVFFRAIKMKSRRLCYYFNAFFTTIALALYLNTECEMEFFTISQKIYS